MNRLNLRACLSPLVVAVSAMLALPSPALADQILEIHDDSLTTYLPSSKSNVQDVRPQVDQRGVDLDGSARLGSSHPMAGAGSPAGDRWNANQALSGVRLNPGTFTVNDVDLAFPAQVPWIIGRSYNARQKDSGGSYFASGGYQGMNWFQSSQPELVFYDSETDSEDVIYLVYGADRFLEFGRAEDDQQQASDDTFKAVNGAAGAILIETDAEGPDLATYYDQKGYRMVFFWFNDGDIDDDIEGSIWKVLDPAGNAAYVGHETDASTALSSGYDATTGAITTAYDSMGRRFTYTYTSGMLTEVKAEDTPGTWNEVGKVEYSYYVDADSHGQDDDLELVTITVPLTDSGVSQVKKKYYWYYEGTYDAVNNPGYHHQLQYVIDFEGYRKYDWDLDSSLDDDPLSASEASLKPYASANFEYDTERRIVSAWFNGACGCGGAASGTHAFEYETNGSYSDGTGYDTTWKSRTIVRKPDATYKTASGAIKAYVTQYFDETGQPLHRVHTDDDPDGASDLWATKVVRNSDGQVTDIHSPANVTGYTHSTGAFTTSTSAGLVTSFTRVSTGDMKGFLEDTKHQTGTSGSAYLDGTLEYYSSATKTVGDVTITRPLVNSRWVYSQVTTTEKDASGDETTLAYTMHTGDAALMPKQITTTHPAVSTSKNGSGSSTTSTRYLRTDGTTAFTEAADGIFTYTQYTDGQLAKRIDDAQTNHGSDFATGDDPNTDFGITETSDGVRRITTYAYDDQGRSDTVTQPDGRVLKRYYSKLADGWSVNLSYSDYDASPLKFYGPVKYTVANHAGRAEVQATVALTNNESSTALTGHVDETDSDPITAMDLGTVAQLTVSVYDRTGGVPASRRLYHDVPASGGGAEGTNFDTTSLAYDDQGRQVRTEAPHGTITRADYDTLGRVVSQWIGTNDSGFDEGESSGTDNMVKTVANEYDSGSDEANSYLTKRTLYVQDSDTDKRETSFSHDVRGRVLLQTNPTAPHSFNKYDNRGRLIATGQFSSTNRIVVGTDDPTTETTNRLALSQTFYDEMGRTWKTQRHKIDDADGSDDDNLQTSTWYDQVGRGIKVDGAELTKTFYDRLGRQTHQFILSDVNDTAYAHADDVTGDHLLQERQTVYESTDSDDVVMTAVIDRYHDDWSAMGGETTGALDTNADNDDLKYTAANLEGRIQITASWYDDFGRLTDTVRYGTYDDNDFDRDGLSVPSRSDTALLTEYAYNTDGTLKEVADPKNLTTRYEYDDAGRQTSVVSNYDDGTPSTDTDQTIKYEYTDGLRTKMTADLPAGETDQQTAYTYGTTKGASAGDSKIATGHLLYKVVYPDVELGETESDYRVLLAYNAQSQQIWTQDQAGGVIETDYDDSGRITHRRVTTLASGLDGDIRRISTTYDNLGRRQLVTQYDNATVGSGSVVDDVKYTYEDWGNLEKFEQDHDSAVGGAGVTDYEVAYTYAKATGGRNTIRRSAMTLPDGTSVTYSYLAVGRLDAKASRVTRVSVGGTIVSQYAYNGVGQVVGTEYQEADVMSEQYGSTSGSYPDLDRFNRVETSRWTKDLATDVDFYDLDIDYDRNSNITLVEDNVHAGFDVAYTIDSLNRLRIAEEGTWSGSAIISRTRQQLWEDTSGNLGLDQVGNWDDVLLDLDGDGNFTGTGEYKDDRSHNDGNELTGRDTDDSGSDDYTQTHDKAGNLTDDGEHYEYEYDAFGRLRKVKDTDDQSLVAEYTYNGLGHRIGWHYDVDADGTVEDTSDDPWYRFAYDDRWRISATFRADDSDPKEQFVYHTAGNDGRGGSSYIDAVVLRDKDANTDWEDESDGTLEDRVYYCQNWRSDVVALVTDTGQQVEQGRYSSYGVPFGLPAGDADSDGDVDSSDLTQIQSWIDAPAYDVRGDLDLDGDVDATDKSTATGKSGKGLAWGTLSGVGNRKGYAGYELDDAITDAYRLYHVRHRVLNADLGRWTRRDPMGYVDGMGQYAYVTSNPTRRIDPDGTCSGDDCDIQIRTCEIEVHSETFSGVCTAPYHISCVSVQYLEWLQGGCEGLDSGTTDEDCEGWGCACSPDHPIGFFVVQSDLLTKNFECDDCVMTVKYIESQLNRDFEGTCRTVVARIPSIDPASRNAEVDVASIIGFGP